MTALYDTFRFRARNIFCILQILSAECILQHMNTSQPPKTFSPEAASAAIDALGGTFAAAEKLQMSAPGVCNWRRKGMAHPWPTVFRYRHNHAYKAAMAIDHPNDVTI
jgi:hypothetical protein